MQFDATLNLIALMLSGAMAAMLAGVLRWFASPTAHAHYRHWATAWFAQAAYYLVGAAAFALGVLAVGGSPIRLVLSIATQVANTIAAAMLVIGALGFARRRQVDHRTLQLALAASVALGLTVALVVNAGEFRLLRAIYRASIASASFIACGVLVWRGRAPQERPARFLSGALVGYGLMQVHYLVYWSLSAIDRRPGYSITWLTLFDLFWITAIGSTMAAMGLADQREESALALQEKESEIQRMIGQSSDIVTILDADLVIRYSSPSAARILGWQDELLGQPIMASIHPDDRGAIIRRMARIDAGEQPPPIQLRFRKKDGNWIRLEAVTSRTVDARGNLRIIVNARDITERDRLEASLRESQKMESVGRLAGGVAHDLNNILTVIGSNAQMTLEATTGAVREALDEILLATDRAADLTRQLLAFARRQVIAPRIYLVADSVERTARMAARLLPESIEFRIKPPSADYFVEADPGQVEQVLMNLIINARDAIVDRGHIDVEVGETDAPANAPDDVPPGRFVTITVRDSGTGIPDSIRSHIFEPFFTTKGVGEGTGLGLATSYGIVRQAGGFLTVESVEGEGSAFTVHLPVVSPAARPTPDSVPSLSQGKGELVLVVEDDRTVRALEVSILTRAGYRVLEASNGVEALAIANSGEPIAALVSDTVMPKLGGLELARRLRERNPQLAVILVSGYPGEAHFLESLPSGALFLQKPLRGGELVERLQSLL